MQVGSSPVAVGIVKHNDHVLLVERNNQDLAANGDILDWAFPGGKIEKNESPQDAVCREVLEETGLNVNVGEIIDERQHPDFPAYIYYIDCQPVNPPDKIKPSDFGIKQAKWVRVPEIKKYIHRPINEKVNEYLTH